MLPILLILQEIFEFEIWNQTVGYVGIAVIHTLFNVTITVMLIPFANKMVDFVYFVIRDSKEEREEAAKKSLKLDMLLLKTPSVAVEASRTVAVEMANLTKTTITDALELLSSYDEKKAQQVCEYEKVIDGYEDKLNGYLVKLAKSSINSDDSRTVSKMMHVIGNLERISDHAVNLVESAQEINEKQLSFSEECRREIEIISEAINENINKAFESYIKDDIALAHKIEPLEEVVDTIIAELKNRHIERLQEEKCTIELGYVYQDILTNFERISDHCSNIAGCLIEIEEKTNIHAYLHNLKHNDTNFRADYNACADHYFAELGIETE